MKYVKMLGLAVVAAMALMAFVGAGTASATTLTSPKGTDLPVGTEIKAESEGVLTLTGGFKNIECQRASGSGTISNAGGTAATVTGAGGAFSTIEGCNCEVVVVTKGRLEIHVIGNGPNGTLTSTEAKVTVNCSTIFGAVHCIYVTENDDVGTLTGSSTTGGTATLDTTAEIRRENTNALCAEEAILHGKGVVTSPDFLDIS